MGIGRILRHKKSRLSEQRLEIPTSYYQPDPPYPSSIRPHSVVEPVFPNSTRSVELDENKSKVWSADGFQHLRHQQRQEELAARTMRRAVEENWRVEEERQRAEAAEHKLKQEQNASAASVRRLRGLIREKYRLDIYVWNKREVQKANRKIIMKDCLKADALLQEIYWIVNAWEESLFEPEEWKVAKKIKEALSKQEDHAVWGDLPPWDRHVHGEY